MTGSTEKGGSDVATGHARRIYDSEKKKERDRVEKDFSLRLTRLRYLVSVWANC